MEDVCPELLAEFLKSFNERDEHYYLYATDEEKEKMRIVKMMHKFPYNYTVMQLLNRFKDAGWIDFSRKFDNNDAESNHTMWIESHTNVGCVLTLEDVRERDYNAERRKRKEKYSSYLVAIVTATGREMLSVNDL